MRKWLSKRLDTPIHLFPWSQTEQEQSRSFGSCGGLTVVGTEGIAIRYDSSRSPQHQGRQIGHEFGHLCAGHHLRAEALGGIPEDLFPDVKIGVTFARFRRDIFTTADELEAERFGMALSNSTTGASVGRWSLAGATFGD